jgi:hypothetical protein
MKTCLFVLLSLCFGVGIVARAQSPDEAPGKHQAAGTQSTCIMGTVSERGQQLTLVTGQRIWKVDNPEILKGHEGHYVRVKAHVHPQKGSLRITDVNMPSASESRENNQKVAHAHRQMCLPLDWSQQAAAGIGWVCYSTGPTVGADARETTRGNTQ